MSVLHQRPENITASLKCLYNGESLIHQVAKISTNVDAYYHYIWNRIGLRSGLGSNIMMLVVSYLIEQHSSSTDVEKCMRDTLLSSQWFSRMEVHHEISYIGSYMENMWAPGIAEPTPFAVLWSMTRRFCSLTVGDDTHLADELLFEDGRRLVFGGGGSERVQRRLRGRHDSLLCVDDNASYRVFMPTVNITGGMTQNTRAKNASYLYLHKLLKEMSRIDFVEFHNKVMLFFHDRDTIAATPAKKEAMMKMIRKFAEEKSFDQLERIRMADFLSSYISGDSKYVSLPASESIDFLEKEKKPPSKPKGDTLDYASVLRGSARHGRVCDRLVALLVCSALVSAKPSGCSGIGGGVTIPFGYLSPIPAKVQNWSKGTGNHQYARIFFGRPADGSALKLFLGEGMNYTPWHMAFRHGSAADERDLRICLAYDALNGPPIELFSTSSSASSEFGFGSVSAGVSTTTAAPCIEEVTKEFHRNRMVEEEKKIILNHFEQIILIQLHDAKPEDRPEMLKRIMDRLHEDLKHALCIF